MTEFFSFFLALYLFDFSTKALVRHFLPLGSEIHLLPFFSLVHVQNTGIAFGLLQGKNVLLIAVGILLSCGLIWMAYQARGKNNAVVMILGIILAGAWGNLTDRIFYGRVTDFLDFFAGAHHWPAFNVADSCICVGAGLMLIQAIRGKA